jgi:NlpC/P60 family putative phage cell wall peptidase
MDEPTEEQLRHEIVQEAHTWLGTPWHHAARVKGAGVDCAQFLIGVYANCGLIEDFTPESYSPDWMLHQSGEKFIEYLLKYTTPTDDPLPGDIAMFQFGRTVSHGSIVIRWPNIIHAYRPERCVVLSDVTVCDLANRVAGFYRHREFSP